MAGLDLTPLKRAAIAYMERDVTPAENGILDEACNMMADFDARFAQYPLLAGPFVARCAMYGRTDIAELKSILDILVTVDALKGRKAI